MFWEQCNIKHYVNRRRRRLLFLLCMCSCVYMIQNILYLYGSEAVKHDWNETKKKSKWEHYICVIAEFLLFFIEIKEVLRWMFSTNGIELTLPTLVVSNNSHNMPRWSVYYWYITAQLKKSRRILLFSIISLSKGNNLNYYLNELCMRLVLYLWEMILRSWSDADAFLLISFFSSLLFLQSVIGPFTFSFFHLSTSTSCQGSTSIYSHKFTQQKKSITL